MVFSGITLRRIGSYPDRIIIENGTVSIVRKIGHIEFDENTSFAKVYGTGEIKCIPSPAIIKNGNQNLIAMSHFVNADNLTADGSCYADGTSYNIYIRDNAHLTMASLRSWFAAQKAAEKPVTLDYVLENTETIDITNTPVGREALKISTQLGNCIISSNTLFDMSYRVDATLAYNELKGALISLGAII